MKIAIIGASGHVGAAITQEALARGHEVTGLVRNIAALPGHPKLRPVPIDVNDVPVLAAKLAGHDAIIHAYSPGRTGPDIFDMFVAGHKAIIAAAKQAGIERLLCVGGAASLKARDGMQLLDSPEWPKEFDPYKDSIRGTRELYYILKKAHELDWVFLSPSAFMTDGERSGSYRTGKDDLLYDAAGRSRITIADYAVAMIDELERPAHHRERFTVGY